MKLKIKILSVLAALVLIPSLVFASLFGFGDSNSANGAKALVQKIIGPRATIVKQFDAIGNLQGFVIKPAGAPAGQAMIVYADKDGKYMVAGNIINAKKQNLSQQYMAKYVQGPEQKAQEKQMPKVYAAAKKTNWFLDGSPKAPHKAYMIIEPNCSICHIVYQAFAPMIKSGQLAIRPIFVAFLKPNSLGKAAAILQAKEPSEMIHSDESKFVMATEEGGLKAAKKISAATKAKIKQNMAFMKKFGYAGTPVIIYKTNKGEAKVLGGAPQAAIMIFQAKQMLKQAKQALKQAKGKTQIATATAQLATATAKAQTMLKQGNQQLVQLVNTMSSD